MHAHAALAPDDLKVDGRLDGRHILVTGIVLAVDGGRSYH